MTSGVGSDLSIEGPQLKLWRSIPVGSFVRLDGTNAFARDHALVVLKTRELIPGVTPIEHAVGAFSFCRLELLTCGGVPCAYVILSTRCKMRVREHYAVWSHDGDHATDPNPLFTDGTLGIIGDDNALVAFVNRRHWIT